MTPKPFKTLDEQINILKGRGLDISNREYAQRILIEENYYNVINGYKLPFLKKNQDDTHCSPEEYLDNCKFEEINSLHNLDRELRTILLSFILKIETHIKTMCAYKFSEKYPNDYSYLNIHNYSKDISDFKNVLSNISTLLSELKKNVNPQRSNSKYISHYIQNHSSVPL